MSQKRPRLKKVLIRGTIGLVVLALAVQGLVLFLNRTEAGQRFVLDQVLSRVQSNLNGTLTVGGIESARLLRGARLKNVVVRDSVGRDVLTADSIGARYSLFGLLRGQVEISDVTLWKPQLHLEKRTVDGVWNVVGLLRTTTPDSAATMAMSREGAVREAPSDPIRLSGLRVYDGSVDILLPLGEPADPRARTVEDPLGSGPMRAIRIEALDGDFERMLYDGDAQERLTAEISDLRMSAYLYENPLRLTELRGQARLFEGRFVLEADRIHLPGSEGSGMVETRFGGETELAGDLRLERLAFQDIAWADARIPDSGTLSGAVELAYRDGRTTADLSGASVEFAGSRLVVDGGVDFDSNLSFRGLQVRADPLVLSDFGPWSESMAERDEVLGVRGTMSGRLGALSLDGRLALIDSTGSSSDSIQYQGVVHLENGMGFSNFEVSAVSTDLGLIRRAFPAWRFDGNGGFRVRANGRLAQGIRVDGTVRYAPGGFDPSMVSAEGTVRRPEGGEIELDLRTQLSPLSLEAVASRYESLPLTGNLRGSVALSGPVSQARFLGVLQTGGGQLDLSGEMNLTDFSQPYRLDGTLDGFRLSQYVEGLPDTTSVTGTIRFAGQGMTADELRGEGDVQLTRVMMGDLRVDRGTLGLRLADGRMMLDSLSLDGANVRVRGSGTLAFRETAPDGEIRIDFSTDDLNGLRDVVFGPGVVAGDDLTSIERELMFIDGIDPDTLPRAVDLALGGRVDGRATLTGSLRNFDVDGDVVLDEIVYGENFVSYADVEFGIRSLPDLEGEMTFVVDSDSISIEGRGFAGGTADVAYTRPEGRGVVTLRRDEEEDYRLRGALDRTDERTVLHIDEMLLRFDEGRWSLGGPSSVEWRDGGVTVRDFRLIQPGRIGVSLAIDGEVREGGAADLNVDVDGLPLDNISRLLQMEDRGIEGILALELDITGQVESPRIEGRIAMRDPIYGEYALDDVQGSLNYRDRNAEIELAGRLNGREILFAEGTIPVDLGLRDVESRIVDAPVDLTVRADSLPVAVLLAVMEDARDVTGTVSGDVSVAGPLNALAPSGQLALSGGSVLLEALGVRHREGVGTFDLRPDGTVEVDLRVRAGGTAHATGTINLRRESGSERLFDPGFDLNIAFDRFVAINRRDLRGEVSGSIQILDRYRSPRVDGTIRVNEGDLFIQEFERNSRIVDLADPSLFELDLDLSRPLLELGYNPFLENLRASVNLELDRNVWIRGPEINVELAGDLNVIYDRGARDVAFTGELTAVRGQYTNIRTFQVVQGGTVTFTGQPGMNPELSIAARTPVRPVEGDPFDITANLEGTLTDPLVTFTTDEPGIANADIPGYLVFGRPTFDVANQSNFAQGAAGSVLTTAAGVGLSQLGSIFAQEVGLDYLSIQQDQSLFSDSGFGSTFNSTRVEVGWYLAPDLFVTLLTRPLSQSSNSQFAGVRLEWTARELFSVEGFWEDRFLRQGISGFGGLGIQASKVGGLFFFREWGY